MKQKLTIHSKPEEIQAFHTERSADLLEELKEKLDTVNETIKSAERAKSEPINITVHLDLI